MTGEHFTEADLWNVAATTAGKIQAALAEEVRSGRVSSSAQALRFVTTWATALETARPDVPKPLAYRSGGLVSGGQLRERNP